MRARSQKATGDHFVTAVALSQLVVARICTAAFSASIEPEKLYQQHCAVCHGADFGGYIGPALNRDAVARHNEAFLRAKIITGGVGTLMPSHPSWSSTLSRQEIAELAAFIKNTPIRPPEWDLSHVRNSLEILVADEASLPAEPAYPIGNIVDLMA